MILPIAKASSYIAIGTINVLGTHIAFSLSSFQAVLGGGNDRHSGQQQVAAFSKNDVTQAIEKSFRL